MVNAAEQLTLFGPVPAGVYGWARPCWLTPARRPVVTVTVKGGYL